MEKLRLSTNFSWKCGFFASQSEGLYEHKALPKEKASRNLKPKCPIIKKTKNQARWKIDMSALVLLIAPPAMASDPANPVSLHVMQANVFITDTDKKHQPHDSHTMPMALSGTESHLTLQHDEGHLHRALPIRGLPPEHES